MDLEWFIKPIIAAIKPLCTMNLTKKERVSFSSAVFFIKTVICKLYCENIEAWEAYACRGNYQCRGRLWKNWWLNSKRVGGSMCCNEGDGKGFETFEEIALAVAKRASINILPRVLKRCHVICLTVSLTLWKFFRSIVCKVISV